MGREKNGKQAIGKSRGGWNTKIHAVTAGDTRVAGFLLSGGNVPDAQAGRLLLETLGKQENTVNLLMDRARGSRKNGNCLRHKCRVEQKNGDVVRKTVGYARFEGENALNALADVYRFLNPLLNYWYPTMRLIAKEKLPSGRYKKIYEKEAKTPYQRLLESPDLSDECKEELRRRTSLLNPVALKRGMDEARERLLKLSVIESIIPSDRVS